MLSELRKKRDITFTSHQKARKSILHLKKRTQIPREAQKTFPDSLNRSPACWVMRLTHKFLQLLTKAPDCSVISVRSRAYLAQCLLSPPEPENQKTDRIIWWIKCFTNGFSSVLIQPITWSKQSDKSIALSSFLLGSKAWNSLLSLLYKTRWAK